MSEIMTDIKNYIDYLRDFGYEVSLAVCGDDAIYGEDLPDLYNYSVHNTKVCAYMKSNGITNGLCVAAKDRLRSNPPKAVCVSFCYAGVCDYVFPAVYGGKTVALAIVTGFRIDNVLVSRQYNDIAARCGGEYVSCYSQLDSRTPDFEQMSAAVTPLLYMLNRLYEFACENSGNRCDEPWYRMSLQYIYDNYMNDINSADIARFVGYSDSYLRRIFRDKCGVAIGTFINNVRLNNAAQLLKTTDYSIANISLMCGYCDPNYFSAAFHKKYGISPKKYRKEQVFTF